MSEADSRALIRTKLRVPALAQGTVRRPRVEEALEAVARDRNVLLIVAAAGAGKTTAMAQFAEIRTGPVVWLTLDEADARPGRFVSYVAAAVETLDPDRARTAREFLENGLSPEDCSALVGEAIPPGAMLVIDDVHHLEAHPATLQALRSLLRSLDPAAVVGLISRRLVNLDLARGVLNGSVGTISDAELAFQVDETAQLLAASNLDADPAQIQDMTGGWAAGIVFDALRGHNAGGSLSPGEDPFFSYLGEEIVDALPLDLRDVVIQSGVLDGVTADRLTALFGDSLPMGSFTRLKRLRLPGTIDADELRYHPCFREYLVARLERDAPETLADVRARHARILRSEGYLEEAVDTLLLCGEVEEAEGLVEEALPAVIRRGDWDKALTWCEAIRPAALRRYPAIRGAQIRSLLMSRRQRDLEWLVKGLQSTGELHRLAETAPDVAAWAIWSLHGQGNWSRLEPLLPRGGSTRRVEMLRYVMKAATSAQPPPDLPDYEMDRPQPIHVALQFALYYQGRFADIDRLALAAHERGPVTATVAQIYRILGLRMRGELAEARELLESAIPQVRTSRFVEFWLNAEAELCFAEGDQERGLELIREARTTSRRHWYPMGDLGIFSSVEGRMLMDMGRYDEAIEHLRATRLWLAQRGMRVFREWTEAWIGGCVLATSGDLGDSVSLLRSATTDMQRSGRDLHLPDAAVFLAEAEWRLGNEDAHDRAADIAYAAALRMGTLVPLRAALAHMPDVLSRRLDSIRDGDPDWGQLARTPLGAPTASAKRSTTVYIQTLGTMGLQVSGTPARTTARAIELARMIADGNGHGVLRESLVNDMLDGSRDGRNYLRQLVHRVRRLLPPTVELLSDDDRLAWRPAELVEADDQAFARLVERARDEVGEARVATLETALEMYDAGPFMPGVDNDFAYQRRNVLKGLAEEASHSLGKVLVEAGRPGDAVVILRRILVANPYQDDAWQLLMRAESSLGGPDAALGIYLECSGALAEVGMEPSPRTEALLAQLRSRDSHTGAPMT